MNELRQNEESTLERAEEAVTENIAKLENVMERLTEKVEDTSHKIQHVVDLGVKQKDELIQLKERTKDKVMPLVNQSVELMNQGRDLSRRVVGRVKEDPKPFLFGALAVVGGLLLMSYLRRRDAYSGYEDRYAA